MRKLFGSSLVALALVACSAREITAPCPDPVVSVSISPDTIFVGQAKQLAAAWQPNDAKVSSVTWTSSAVQIATVSNTGIIAGVAVGETNITVKVACCEGRVSKEATAKVVVRERSKLSTTIVVAPDTMRLYVGDKSRASAAVSGEPGISLSVLWTSETPAIATVSNTGEITGVSPGISGVRARAAADTAKSGRIVVVVSKVPDAIPSPTLTFFTKPAQIVVGDSSKAEWSSVGTATCMRTSLPAIPAWSGVSVTSGSQNLVGLPVGRYNLTQSCTGAGGTVSVTTTLEVVAAPPPPGPSSSSSIVAIPSIFVVGGTTSVRWDSQNTTSCTKSATPAISAWNGSAAVSGTQTLSGLAIGTYTVFIACNGPGGPTSASTTIQVVATAPPPAPNPTSTIVSNPSRFEVGGTTAVTWNSQNTTSCTKSATPAISAWNGSAAVSGTQTLSGLAIGTYTLLVTCVGPGGTTSASTTIFVTEALVPPKETEMVVRFAANRSTAFVNQGVFVSGEALGAKSCSASSSPAIPLWTGSKPTALFTSEIGFPQPGLYRVSYTCVSTNGLHTSTNSIDIRVVEREEPPPQDGKYVRSITITPKTDTLKKGESQEFLVVVVADEGVTRAFECESTNALYAKVTVATTGCKVEILAESTTADVRFQVIARTIGLARASDGRLLPLEASSLVTILKK